MTHKKVACYFIRMAVSGIFLLMLSLNASAKNILLTNDDGLTSNIVALYSALKESGHDVIVSVPCQGQSGMGAAILFLKPIKPLPEACLGRAALSGDPGVGPVTKKDENFSYTDFYYVNGTPVMATSYGLDVLAPKRWGGAPDLVLSGPNEGRNTGPMINASGTVSNVQFAAARGIPAIALSAGMNTAGKEESDGNIVNNPLSVVVAELSNTLVSHLEGSSDGDALLPESLALNVNFPDDVSHDTAWQLTRIGTYNEYTLAFSEDLSQDSFARSYGLAEQPYPGFTIAYNSTAPTQEQIDNEAYVAQNAISVSVMQVSFGTEKAEHDWLRSRLSELLE
ncbi:MAG: 5'/3'-nucleotidase SurE [Porticoccaceae bacterium]|nr:5'/3'-nucleotidase SurE [Porticoccaceae bacterium]